MAGLNLNYDLSQEFEFRAKINSTTTKEECKIPENIEEIELWTDGSLKRENNKMGAGILILDNKGKHLKEIMIKIDNHNPSSTKAELIAILGALEICNINQKLKIYTDSQCAIDGCTNILVNKNTRSELKYKNLHILEQIKILMNQFTNTPTFVKVAAHTNLVNNDIADDLAKRAAESSKEPFKINNYSGKLYIFKNTVILNGYPNHVMRDLDQTKLSELNKIYLNKKWTMSNIDWKQTLKVCYQGINMDNSLDTSDVKEQSFRIQLFSRNLPVLKLVQKWNSRKYTYTLNSLCPRCKNTEETIEHLIKCPNNIKISSKLYRYTTKLITERINKNKIYKDLKDQHLKPSNKHLMYLIGFNNFKSFISTPATFGLITQEIIERFKKIKHTKNHTILWIQLVIDCWLSTVYEHIWKERCKDLMNANQQVSGNKRTNNSEPQNTIKRIKLILHKQKPSSNPTSLLTHQERNPIRLRTYVGSRSNLHESNLPRNKIKKTYINSGKTTQIVQPNTNDPSPLTSYKRQCEQDNPKELDHIKKIRLKLRLPQIVIKFKIPPDLNHRIVNGKDPTPAIDSIVGAKDDGGGGSPNLVDCGTG